jgi:hypothetical protein
MMNTYDVSINYSYKYKVPSAAALVNVKQVHTSYSIQSRLCYVLNYLYLRLWLITAGTMEQF